MKKRILLGLLTVLTIFGLASCKEKDDPTPDNVETITIAEAIEICKELTSVSEERYVIDAVIVKILNPAYGQMTLKDDTGTIEVYGSYDADGVKGYAALEEKPYAGDKVRVSALLQNFNGKYEIKSAWILSFEHIEEDFNEADYEAMSIAEARNAAKDKKLILEGVVAKISYANGKIPNGFYLVDSTNSIYVYDSQITPRVKIGNKIKIAAVKDYWILADEEQSAAQFGYKGACQVTNAHLLKNDEMVNNSFDKGWIKETTVKEIMDTPFSENITSTIFKVNALIKKEEGHGFVNYYFYDIDGKTGSYTYTQCNGGDFEWLDSYDGKICTVYLSPLNAKSSGAGCVWRFFPILVKDENYQFDVTKAAEFAVTYYGVDQFLKTYNSDPKLEVITNVSSDLLDVKNIQLSYDSSDSSVLSFDKEEDKVIMHAKKTGTVTITVKGAHNNINYSKEVIVSVDIKDIPQNTLTVQEVIDLKVYDGTTISEVDVLVRGIAGPSLANQTGFYLIDSTGVIAVRTSTDTMSKISLGNEVILKGKRTVTQGSKPKPDVFGESVISNAELVLNLFGSNEYSRESFIKDKTLDEIINLPVSEDHTTQGYILEAKIQVVEAQFYGNIYLVSPSDDSKQIILYSSDARKEYNWLKEFDGKTIKLELMLCNWNSKDVYGACVLSATADDGRVLYNTIKYAK